MALAYDSRRATRDVDALFKPHGIVLEEALAVAAELGLPRWWLNEQASSYVAPGGDPAASFAARPRDAEDIRLHTADDVLASVSEIFPDEEPPARLRLLLEDIFSDQGNLSTLALLQALKARPRRTCPEAPQRPFMRRMRVDDLAVLTS
jgi:hypothetical protein